MTKYNKHVITALKKSEEEMYNLSHSIVGIEHLILGTLSFKNSISSLLNKHNINYENYKSKLLEFKKSNINKNKFVFYSFNLKKIIDLANDNAIQFSSNEITLEHIFMSIAEENEGTGINILQKLGLNIDVFYKDIVKIVKNNKNLLIFGLGTNLNELANNNKLDKLIGRNKEINEIIKILARKNKNNPILIGEAGVGKTALIEGLASRIVNNKVPEFLKNKIIVSLNIATVISGTKYRGEFEEKLTKILKECEEVDNIIIFIDEVHTIVGAGGAEGAIDASNILKPILARGNLKIIGATTLNEYKKFILSDKALDRRFQKVYVNEPTKEETLNILKKIKKDYEKFHNVSIDDNILESIITLSNKYIYDRKEPDKSIDIMDEICATTNINANQKIFLKYKKELNKIKSEKEVAIIKENYLEAEKFKEQEKKILIKLKDLKEEKKKVTIIYLKKVIESKCNSKIYDINKKDDFKLIENKLNKKIVGQEKAIKELINILKLSNVKKDKKPISVLIYGSTGIGKTEAIKSLAKINNYNLIKLEMSEYSSEISVNKLIGSPQGYVGYNDNNTSLEEIIFKPNSIILLEEIDKAHANVINLFLNLLEEGTLKTSKGEILSFQNSIIIMTTSNLEINSVGYINNKKNLNYIEHFSNEFINRINYIIEFKSLTEKDISNIIDLNIKSINKHYDKNVKLSKKDIDYIIAKSNYKIFGARNINNILKKHIEKILVSSKTL